MKTKFTPCRKTKTKSAEPAAPTKPIVPYNHFGVRRGGCPPPPPLGLGRGRQQPLWRRFTCNCCIPPRGGHSPASAGRQLGVKRHGLYAQSTIYSTSALNSNVEHANPVDPPSNAAHWSNVVFAICSQTGTFTEGDSPSWLTICHGTHGQPAKTTSLEDSET